jgi:hypothetical protein
MRSAALVAGGAMAGGLPRVFAADAANGFIWAALLHMGTNMWCDHVVSRRTWGPYRGEDVKLLCAADHLRFDEEVWKRVTGRMAEVGMNMVVIDLGEAIRYPSHPELAVTGSWEIDRFRKELARLRAMGLEPIPKMNFSTTHDVWLKDYHRMVSTKPYYKVCSDLIRDVAEIFDHPRFLHLGYDEESEDLQRQHDYCIVRHGELWWHDFLWFMQETGKAGMRPWVWSDYAWRHPHFLARCPKNVLQSNWYYETDFDDQKKDAKRSLKTFEELDKSGFEQIPTGSNWDSDENFAKLDAYCRKVCSPSRLKGMMTAPWAFTLPGVHEEKLLAAVDQVGAAIKVSAKLRKGRV